MQILSYMHYKVRKGFIQLIFFTSSHKYAISPNTCLPLYGARAVKGVHACEHVAAMRFLSCCLETGSSTEPEASLTRLAAQRMFCPCSGNALPTPLVSYRYLYISLDFYGGSGDSN